MQTPIGFCTFFIIFSSIFFAACSAAEHSDEYSTNNGNENEDFDDSAEPINIADQKRHHGDIVQLWDESELQRSDIMRNALKPDSDDRWVRMKDAEGNYLIPYVITGFYDAAKRATIQKAMNAIAANTCVRFKPRNGEFDYVEIQNKKDEGCYTIVGRVSGQNVVMLEDNRIGTCVVYATVVHELLHKVGLWHEQMRYDRDNYITVMYQNISPSMWPQFRKIPESQSHIYGVKYDYKSVMHYDKFAFASAPRKITMKTKDSAMEDVIGTAKDASEGDWTKICSIYQCAKCRGQPFGDDSGNKGNDGRPNSGNGAGGTDSQPPSEDSSGSGCPSGLGGTKHRLKLGVGVDIFDAIDTGVATLENMNIYD